MARAKRHYIPYQIWHITQRCHKREFLLKFKQDRYRTEGLLGLFEPGMAKTILIPMGDWCGSTSIDLTDQIEATGAEEGKQRKRRLNNM